jgi:hypothetical protein
VDRVGDLRRIRSDAPLILMDGAFFLEEERIFLWEELPFRSDARAIPRITALPRSDHPGILSDPAGIPSDARRIHQEHCSIHQEQRPIRR